MLGFPPPFSFAQRPFVEIVNRNRWTQPETQPGFSHFHKFHFPAESSWTLLGQLVGRQKDAFFDKFDKFPLWRL